MTTRYYPPDDSSSFTDPIAAQAQSTYENYKKIKGFEDVGYFLLAYVVSGGAVTQNITRNDTIDIADIVVSLHDDIMARNGTSFRSKIANTNYYLDFTSNGDWSWGTSHPNGLIGTDYLTIATVTTNGSKNIASITDTRGPVGGFRLKSDYDLEDYALKAEVAAQLADIAMNVKTFGADPTGVNDSTAAFIAAVAAVETAEYTEAIPSVGARAKILIPPGMYKISSTVKFPSYIDVEGAGRNTTIIVSDITNGDPVFLVKNDLTVQQFYNTLSGFTISGGRKNCQGIQINKTSRWVLRDVIINQTAGEGLSIYESYLGEIYSCLIRACGDSTRYSVSLSGPNANGGSHAVSFFGGEINGGTGAVNGVYIKHGTSIGFFGTTIEGFPTGIGLSNENGNALSVNSCYFEGNKEHIVEVGATLGTSYVSCYFGPPSAGSRGHIGIFYAQGSKIEGNYFQGSATTKIFDSTGTNNGRLHMSSVKGNYAATFPINIDASLITSARASGTVIETFDGSLGASLYGSHTFKDSMVLEGNFQPNLGITRLNNLNAVVKAGSASPEGVETATRGLFVNAGGATDTSFYAKKSGTNNAVGWLPGQLISATTTAGRPAVTTAGFMNFDATIDKPIWWNGASWITTMSRFVSVPASATATGNQGDWSADASYLYMCHATNTWKRVAIAAW